MATGIDTGKFGARELEYRGFQAGLVLDVDPAEIGPMQASDLANVDLDGVALKKRKGRTPYNATAAAGVAQALAAYYPAAGGRYLLLGASSGGSFVVYADTNNDGDFLDAGETLLSVAPSLGSPAGADFAQYRENLYIAPRYAPLYRWRGAGAAVAVANLTAPAAPVLALSRVTLEDFNASGGWTNTDPVHITLANTTYPDGTVILAMTITGDCAGCYIHKPWSSGATVDLSAAEKVRIQFYSPNPGVTFQVAVKDNSGAINWDAFPYQSVTPDQEDKWLTLEVPLAGIAPAQRTASTGLAIRYISKPAALAYPFTVYFENAKAEGPLPSDTYRYYATYYSSTTRQESPASPAAVHVLNTDQVWTAGIDVAYAATAQTDWTGATVDKIRLYRFRDQGPFSRPVLVAEVANGSGTYTDARSDGDLAVTAAVELLTGKVDPPKAGCMAVVNQRLILADVIESDGTHRPYRLHLSRLGYPEEFGATFPPVDGSAGGWLDIPTRDSIRRVVEFDQEAVIFCDRSIWSLSGSTWSTFELKKRLDVGLSARSGLTVDDRSIYFLAPDGVRILLPNAGNVGVWDSWVLSEPVGSLLRAIPKAYRENTALAIDERRRLVVAYTPSGGTTNAEALILDPQADGALSRGVNPARPGWTRYTSWAASCFLALGRGGLDNGELLAGDTATGKAWYVNTGETDNGSAIAWYWQGKAERRDTGRQLAAVYATAEMGAQSGASVTAAAILDRGASTASVTLNLGTASAGSVFPEERFPATARAHWLQAKISGSHSAAMAVYAFRVGVYGR